MRSIELSDNTTHKTCEVLRSVLEQASTNGMIIGEMRKRGKILDKLETANGVLELEESEYQTLKEAYAAFQWRVHHKDLLAIWDAIEQAKGV